MSTQVETAEFQAEAQKLLQLMVHAIYSNKDTFLRELISNASDALDKLRLASYQDKDLQVDTEDLHISVEPDREQRTLTIRDNGIGMSKDEVRDLIGTIAKSGTAELLQELKDTSDGAAAQELIGQFGLGFYSSFMVADKVVLLTRKAGEDSATRWESSGEGTYTIETVDEAPQGTAVTLHLKAEDQEDRLLDYADTGTLTRIIKKHSDFIAWPIRMEVDKPGAEGESTTEVETVNSMKALWARPKGEVEQAEYDEFYKHISHDWNDPLETIHLRAEGTFEYQALLFIPSTAPFDLFSRDQKRGTQLYVKRVFIMDDCEELMPEYLRFVKGVVDAQDLSLNVSREILQQDRRIQMVRRRLVKKVLTTVQEIQANDAERYTTFWDNFGQAVKEGIVGDPDNAELVLDISSFESTHHESDRTTLRQYVERMPADQDVIYYITGNSRTKIENSPHIEAFRDKGVEVLLLSDPIDEMWVESVPEFDGKRFQSITKGEVDLDEKTEEDSQQQEEFAGVLSWLGEALSDDVKEVRLSSRLSSSPACIVGDNHDMTPTLEKMYRAMGQQVPRVKRILEINPSHPLVTGLRSAHTADGERADLAETAQLLYGMALLAEGGELRDPAKFTSLLANRLATTL
ncbi:MULTISPECIES: molecular chaperone HtpG [unclassified Saccharopolyspora]|uniref:molecular chaperone HtpG n=1 Tax=unclassified Saccharopolyspora TaxID=2646250 RepID=UPI001CD196D1|nr:MULTISPECIES: molecular chaperone HtpG [unclassified Saccharopolyspora]MCA1229832.1 molecular chaperone HtpG [Saccharopolyspora sp. 6M]MCA1278573.1 molecular chaperone HtpG [Saccharopolyspora sp. 7B]